MKTKQLSVIGSLYFAVVVVWPGRLPPRHQPLHRRHLGVFGRQESHGGRVRNHAGQIPGLRRGHGGEKIGAGLSPDGTGECQDEAFVKVLTEKGKRGNRTLSLSFMLPYSTEEVVKLEVIKPGRHGEPVDVAANSKETIDDSQMQMNIYDPNSRVLQVNIPKVEIGDVVHSISRQTITRSFMPGICGGKRF
jgi:hypothetical protein